MTQVTARAGRRFQDAAVAWNENRDRRTGMRQQHADIRRERMSCSSSVRTFTQTQDWTRNMEMSPSGRFRVVENSRERNPVVTRDTIRWDAAVAVIILLTVLVFGTILADVAGIGISSKNITRLNSKIENISQKNDALRTQLMTSSGDVSVCTEAVKLNLIASGGATTISLTAPVNATLQFSAAAETQTQEIPGDRLASIMGD